MLPIRTLTRELKVLDFDIENRPITYAGGDYTFSDITAIAASFYGEEKVHVWTIETGKRNEYEEMLLGFKALYDQAEMVTGHYIRRHDLPIINGAFMEFGIEPLAAKLTSCTKEDLLTIKGISASQENLSAMYELSNGKYHMNQVMWKEANRLWEKGVKLTRKRVVDDVKQHKELRPRVNLEGWMKGPQRWSGK